MIVLAHGMFGICPQEFPYIAAGLSAGAFACRYCWMKYKAWRGS